MAITDLASVLRRPEQKQVHFVEPDEMLLGVQLDQR